MAVDEPEPPTSSPPPSVSVNSTPTIHLDDQILAIRAEIAKLRAHKSRLSSALLGSSKIHKVAQARKTYIQTSRAQGKSSLSDTIDTLQEKLEQAIQTQQSENDIKIHRLAYGVTAFPFTDPSPERVGEPTLTGVRFDLGLLNVKRDTEGSANEARTSIPESYFVILKRLQQRKTDSNGDRVTAVYLRVHHHTIPAHIDLEGLIAKYLPLPQELQDAQSNMDVDEQEEDASRRQSESFRDDSGIDVTQDIIVTGTLTAPVPVNEANTSQQSRRVQVRGNGQDLHKFVFAVRDDLQSWHYRTKSIAYLRDAVGLPPQRTPGLESNENGDEDDIEEDDERSSVVNGVMDGRNIKTQPKYHVSELTRTTADAYQVRVVWRDDSLGLLKLAHDGIVERAVVFGVSRDTTGASSSDNQEHERLYDIERVLMFNKAGEKMHIQHLLEGLQRCEKYFKHS